MFRKSLLALSALAVIAGAALAPTSASAGWKGKHWGHHWGHGHGYYGYGYGYPSYGYASYGYGCWVKKWIDTPYGPRLKSIYVCY